MALSFNALINGGKLTGIRFVEGAGDKGKMTDVQALQSDRVITENTSLQMRRFMVESVRKATDGRIADMGGFWKTYFEKRDDLRPHHQRIGHVVGAFFTPADSPEYLALLDIPPADDLHAPVKMEKELGLKIGQELIQ